MPTTTITAKQLKAKLDAKEDLFLLDVREPVEFDYTHIANSVLIPLNQIPQRLKEIDFDKEVIVICHHGIRSMQAANFLGQVGFRRISNLTGGIEAWAVECDPAMPRY